MTQINRLYSDEMVNGADNDVDPLNDELDQLVASHNDLDNTITALTTEVGAKAGIGDSNSFTGNNTFSGRANFSHTADPGSPQDGDFWYNETDESFKIKVNGSVSTLSNIPSFIYGPAPVYASASTITLPAGLGARDSSGIVNIEMGTDLTLDITASGAGGLDTGTEANSTYYYVYLIRKSSDGTVSAIFSTANEARSGSVTMPAGYDQKRQLPFAVYNDSSGNIVRFIVTNWPYLSSVVFNNQRFGSITSTFGVMVLTSGGATSYTSISGLLPEISALGHYALGGAFSGSSFYHVRQTGSTGDGVSFSTGSGYTVSQLPVYVMTDSSGNIEYKVSSGTLDIGLVGFTVTEIV